MIWKIKKIGSEKSVYINLAENSTYHYHHLVRVRKLLANYSLINYTYASCQLHLCGLESVFWRVKLKKAQKLILSIQKLLTNVENEKLLALGVDNTENRSSWLQILHAHCSRFAAGKYFN